MRVFFVVEQNLPSVVVGHVLGPRPGERILDMCAAPGGKTCHIAALMRDQVQVTDVCCSRDQREYLGFQSENAGYKIHIYCTARSSAVVPKIGVGAL